MQNNRRCGEKCVCMVVWGGGGGDEGELREREHVRARVYVLCVF